MLRLPVPLFLLCCLLASCAAHQNPEPPKKAAPGLLPTTPDDVRFIRKILSECRELDCGTCSAGHWMQINKLGDRRLIAACQVLITKPESAADLANAFAILSNAKGDRRHFAVPAASAVGHPDWWVRVSAAQLHCDIGTRNEAPALVPLLYAKDTDQTYPVEIQQANTAEMIGAAVKGLAAIGGPNELVALDAWLAKVDRDSIYLDFKDIEKLRDEFANRLAREAKTPAKEKP
jgi:hypothetical protein